ncbi:hypothetical protein ACFQGA_16290 [Marinobacter koreensis]|uniref:Uncharacterized protein n=1 Tax=Marinobacter koreensis TaxID=335974 RepID=A0ABW0RS73_9GAMM|nr:hypothetical protein [Marinobacter koreensis]MCK7549254.1 hypothetical protein [Marinobacter koreensis]
MKMTEMEKLNLLREAEAIAASVSEKLQACYEAHCKAAGYSEDKAA